MSALLTMVLVFVISVAVFLVSAIGIGGRAGRTSAGRGAVYLERAADHLNGDAEPPKALVRLFGAA